MNIIVNKIRKNTIRDRIFETAIETITNDIVTFEGNENELQQYITDNLLYGQLNRSKSWVILWGNNVLFDGFSSENEVQPFYHDLDRRIHKSVILARDVQPITNHERTYINKQLAKSSSEWRVNKQADIYVTENSEAVAWLLGFNTSGLTCEEIKKLIDVRNVWYDSENTRKYFVAT